MISPETKAVDIYSSAESMVNSYHKGIETLTEAYALMKKAKGLLGHAIQYPVTMSRGYYRDNLSKSDLAEVIKENQKGAWDRIIEKMQLRHLLSNKRYRQIKDQIDKGDVPELTVDNIHSLVQDVSANMGNYLKECIAETFEWLIPFHRSDFKTNKTHKVGPKVIKDCVVDEYGISHYREQNLISLDNVFHLLDGKGPIKHPGNLVAVIMETMRDTRENECETPYFRVRWFKKGTMHIWFKREDLLNELNRIGAGGKPHIGKTST